ncbi:PilZ domain-containing protein [Shewanella sp. 125m-7]
MDDRRLFSRLIFTTDAKLINHDNSWETKLVDISLNGALVERPQGFALTDAPLTLEFTIQDSEVCVQMQTRVVHQKDNQLGLACQYIDVESISHLRRILELNLGDATLLDRELERLFEQNNNTNT